MQRPAPLGGVLLDLGLGGGERGLGRFGQLRAHAGERGALLLVCRVDAAMVRFDPLLHLGDQLRLAFSEPLDLGAQALLELLQVAGECGDPLFGACCARLSASAISVRACSSRSAIRRCPFERERALLLGEHRARVGAGPGQRPAELRGPALVLLLDQARETRFCRGKVSLGVPPPLECRGQDERAELGKRAERQPGGGGAEPRSRLEDKGDPSTERGDRTRERHGLEQCPGRAEGAPRRTRRPRGWPLPRRLPGTRTLRSRRGHPTRGGEGARERARSSPPARSWSAASGARMSVSASICSTVPSACSTVPETERVRRRTVRTTVERRRCATLNRKAYAATRNASALSSSAIVKYAVSAGNAPQASANHSVLWKRPRPSSRLYATTMNAPKATNASSHRSYRIAAKTPSATAPAMERAASAASVRPGIRVCSGRPISSSSACAPMPEREEERGEHEPQPRPRESRRDRGPDSDVAQVPQRVRRMEQRDVVAPASRAQRVERRPRLGGHSPPAPDDDPAAEAQAADTDVLDARLPPQRELPVEWQPRVEVPDARRAGTRPPRPSPRR